MPAKPAAMERFHHDDGLGAVGFDDGHAVNRAALVLARGGIDDVVGADDEAHVHAGPS